MSGHIFFGERWYGFDDATYTAARLLEILSRSDEPERGAQRAADELHHARAERALRRGRAPPRVVARAARRPRPPASPAREVITIDGLRVEYDDGFGLIRASNTTPVLVLRFEGHTAAALQRIEAGCMAALRRVKPDAKISAAAH